MNTPTQNTEQTFCGAMKWTKQQGLDGLYRIRQGAGLVCRDLTEADCDRILALLADNQRLREQVGQLREALTLAQATIERLATQHGPFNSAQGTLDVINAALSAVERGQK